MYTLDGFVCVSLRANDAERAGGFAPWELPPGKEQHGSNLLLEVARAVLYERTAFVQTSSVLSRALPVWPVRLE